MIPPTRMSPKGLKLNPSRKIRTPTRALTTRLTGTTTTAMPLDDDGDDSAENGDSDADGASDGDTDSERRLGLRL